MSLVASRYAAVSADGSGPGEATELRNEDELIAHRLNGSIIHDAASVDGKWERQCHACVSNCS